MFERTVVGWVMLLAGSLAGSMAGSAMAADLSKDFVAMTQTVVEYSYPIKLSRYKDNAYIDLVANEKDAAYDTPEAAITSHFSAMRKGDVDWFLRTWNDSGARRIQQRMSDRKLVAADVGREWKEQFGADGRIRLEKYGELGALVLVKYQLMKGETVSIQDTLVLRREPSGWRLTQELASDPIQQLWDTDQRRFTSLAPVVMESTARPSKR